ncbi:MAG: hypothetical protein KC502_23000, partial [Myxococcales bacterium]|nr:hypothetical protein [Myxococcales bacterium]
MKRAWIGRDLRLRSVMQGWPAQLLLAAVVMLVVAVTLPTMALATVASDVPESKAYTAVLDLTIPVKAKFHTTPPAYKVNTTQTLSHTFDRVAYFLELQAKGQPRRFMWVSMRAFTADASQLGIPHIGTGTFFQRLVQQMNVVTNQPGVSGGTGIKTGNIEFWPSNYGTSNAKQVPNGSAAVYDMGDAPTTGAGYGSLQIHNHGTKTTLMAYNSWGTGALGDIGIGNNTTKTPDGKVHSDWTFHHNTAAFVLRRLRVFVRKGPTPGELAFKMNSPQPHEVFQRNVYGQRWIRVAGSLHNVLGDQLLARAISVQGGKDTAWQLIDPQPGKTFVGHLFLSQGWYKLEVRLMAGKTIAAQMTTKPFGVGEVFITAGQSNSANSGKPALSPKDTRVGAFGPSGWQFAADPQPIATGGGGTPWAPLGDLLLAKLGVPIGFISVGWGGTSVAQWQPGAAKKLFPRLQLALTEVGPKGARAVLWHQGESDAAGKTSTAVYAQRLAAIIGASRKDGGWPIPWYVARVGYLPKVTAGAIAAVVAGQQKVIDDDPATFPGPKTDDLIGSKWRHDKVHFNEAGLKEHAKRWAQAIPVPTIKIPPDAGGADAGASDAGSTDAGSVDGGAPDTGVADTGISDAGVPDGGDLDAALPDADSADSVGADTGGTDTGSADTGSADTGSADTGSADTGSAAGSDADLADGNAGPDTGANADTG